MTLERGRSQLQQMQGFMQWACRTLVSGLYPGGPYARKLLCVELLNAVLDCWATAGGATRPGGGGGGPAGGGGGAGGGSSGGGTASRSQAGRKPAKALRLASPAADNRRLVAAGTGGAEGHQATVSFDPFSTGFLGPHSVSLLLNGVVDSWDRCEPAVWGAGLGKRWRPGCEPQWGVQGTGLGRGSNTW